MQITDSR